MSRRNRKHSVIDQLPENQKDTVEQMLLSGSTYAEIVDYLAENGTQLSTASVCRYAQAFQANIEMLNMAQENFKHVMEMVDRYPDLDASEAIIRLASQNVFNALATAPEDKWKDVDIDALLRQANGLVRASAYKKRLDLQNQTDYEAGLDAVKTMVFHTMQSERPELYKEVVQFLNQKQAEGNPNTRTGK